MVSSLTSPIASPLKPGPAKDLNIHGIHISNRPPQVGLRVEIDRNALAVGRQFPAGSLPTEGKASAKARDPCAQPALVNAAEDRCKNAGHSPVACHLGYGSSCQRASSFPSSPMYSEMFPNKAMISSNPRGLANGGLSSAADRASLVATGDSSISLLLSGLRAIKMIAAV
jgi:hypothetical protein